MGWFLSFIPRRWLQDALYEQFARSLPREERIRLHYIGATGNPRHHKFQWADDIVTDRKD